MQIVFGFLNDFSFANDWPLTSDQQCPTPQRPHHQARPTQAWARLQLPPRRTLWPLSAGDVTPMPRPVPLHLCLLSIPHADEPEQAANSTRLPSASTPPLIPIGHSHLLHFVNWSCLLSLAVGTRETDSTWGLNVIHGIKSYDLSIQNEYDGTFRFSLQTLNRNLLLLLLRSRDC